MTRFARLPQESIGQDDLAWDYAAFAARAYPALDAHLLVAESYLLANKPLTAGLYLKSTVRFWLTTHPIPYGDDANGDSTHDTFIAVIDTVAFNYPSPGLNYLTGTGITITLVNTVPVVSNEFVFSRVLPHAWLEQHFPGAITRLQIGAELGLTKEEQAQHGLYDQSGLYAPSGTTQAIDLPFDLAPH